ncbi:MAG: methionyl-tRNA formyltransferase, partial [Clostridia bacterium]
MRVLYMGTPDFAVPSLKKIQSTGHCVCAVITQPDKPQGRGMKMTAPPVKVLALSDGIPVYQPETLKDGAIAPLLCELKPDVIVVVAYGKLLPQYVLEFPRYGCVNLHGSLLPKYRGAAPIQRAVINGECESGVSTMFLNEGMDTGDVIFSEKTAIGERDTAEDLFVKLADIGAELLVKTINAIEDGTAPRAAQDNTQATYAPMLSKESAVIDWSASDTEILNLVRGCYSWPIATTSHDGVKIKVYSAQTGSETSAPSGRVIACDESGMQVAAGNGRSIRITMLQFTGGKRMAPCEYFRGHESI